MRAVFVRLIAAPSTMRARIYICTVSDVKVYLDKIWGDNLSLTKKPGHNVASRRRAWYTGAASILNWYGGKAWLSRVQSRQPSSQHPTKIVLHHVAVGALVALARAAGTHQRTERG